MVRQIHNLSTSLEVEVDEVNGDELNGGLHDGGNHFPKP